MILSHGWRFVNVDEVDNGAFFDIVCKTLELGCHRQASLILARDESDYNVLALICRVAKLVIHDSVQLVRGSQFLNSFFGFLCRRFVLLFIELFGLLRNITGTALRESIVVAIILPLLGLAAIVSWRHIIFTTRD